VRNRMLVASPVVRGGGANLRDETTVAQNGHPGLRVSRPSPYIFPIAMAGTAASA
jgi:hypothetical protein